MKNCYKLTIFSSAIRRNRFQLSPQFNSRRSCYDVILVTFRKSFKFCSSTSKRRTQLKSIFIVLTPKGGLSMLLTVYNMQSSTHTLIGLLCAPLKSSLWGNLVEKYFWLKIHSKSTRYRSKQKTNMAEVKRACDSDCWPNSFPSVTIIFHGGTTHTLCDPFPWRYDPFPLMHDPYPWCTTISIMYDPFHWGTIHFLDVRAISMMYDPFPLRYDSFPSKYDPFTQSYDPLTKRYDRFPLRYDPFPNFVRNPPPYRSPGVGDKYLGNLPAMWESNWYALELWSGLSILPCALPATISTKARSVRVRPNTPIPCTASRRTTGKSCIRL